MKLAAREQEEEPLRTMGHAWKPDKQTKEKKSEMPVV